MQVNSLDDFIKLIPENLETALEKARFLYIELGKRSFYDADYKYYMFEEDEQYSCYSYKTYSNPNIIICTTLSKQYVELLKKAGIESELMYDDSHYLVKFYDDNGRAHISDITNDLKNIQFGCKTSYFGTQTINFNELKDIDIKLGYIKQKLGYTDDYWYIVKKALEDNKLSENKKLEIVLNNLQKFGNLSKLGDTEIFYLYQKFIRYCLPHNSNITFYSTKTNMNDKEKCVIKICEGDQKTNYVLNFETRLFEKEGQHNKQLQDKDEYER